MHHAFTVATVAGIGGFLSWLFSLWSRDEAQVSAWADPIISVFLGAGAGIIFVFLVSNTNREDKPRLISLALLSGFFWMPVWEGSRALIDDRQQRSHEAETRQALTAATDIATRLVDASETDRPALIQEMQSATDRLAKLSGRIESVSALTAIEVATAPLSGQLSSLDEADRTKILTPLAEVGLLENSADTMLPIAIRWAGSDEVPLTDEMTFEWTSADDFKSRDLEVLQGIESLKDQVELLQVELEKETT